MSTHELNLIKLSIRQNHVKTTDISKLNKPPVSLNTPTTVSVQSSEKKSKNKSKKLSRADKKAAADKAKADKKAAVEKKKMEQQTKVKQIQAEKAAKKANQKSVYTRLTSIFKK